MGPDPLPERIPPPVWAPAAPPYGQQPIVVPPPRPIKNPGTAALLAGLLGPLGMLYATVPGAAILFGVNIVILMVGFVTFGLGFILWLASWVIGIIWAYNAADTHNKAAYAYPYPLQHYPPPPPPPQQYPYPPPWA